MSPQHDPGEAQDEGPQDHQHPQWNGQHQVVQDEPRHQGGPRGMARGKGVLVHREGDKHVHLVVGWATPADQPFEQGHQQQVQKQSKEQVHQHLAPGPAVAPGQAVEGAQQPGDAVSRDLQQLHQGPHAAPGRALPGAHPQLLGQPQVDGQQGAQSDAQEGRVQVDAVLLGQRGRGRLRGDGPRQREGAAPVHRALGHAEPGAGGVRARRAAAEQGLELEPAAAAAAAAVGRAAGAAAAAAARGRGAQGANLHVPPGARHRGGRPGPQNPDGLRTGSPALQPLPLPHCYPGGAGRRRRERTIVTPGGDVG